MSVQKYSTPGVVKREVDNTVRTNAQPGDGRGAIVLQANKGYVNQRINSNSLSDFYESFGTPDNSNQFGHFAAAQFFGAGSTQLLAVRATMGDEGYAQLQYPYTDAFDVKLLDTTQEFRFVDNSLTDNLKLINLINSASWSVLSAAGYDITKTSGAEPQFGVFAKADRAILKDVTDEFNGDDSYSMYVYRDDSDGAKTSVSSTKQGRYFRFINTSGRGGKYVEFTVLDDAYNNGSFKNYSGTLDTNTAWFKTTSGTGDFWSTDMYIPANSAVNNIGGWLAQNVMVHNSALLTDGAISESVDVSALIGSKNLEICSATANTVYDTTSEILHPYLKSKDGTDGQTVSYLSVTDWDDGVIKNFTVRTAEENSIGAKNLYPSTHKDVEAIEFKEYGFADYSNELIIKDSVTASACDKFKSETEYKKLVEVAESYGLDAAEISTEKYGIISYHPAKTWFSDDDTVEKLIKLDEDHAITNGNYTGITEATFVAYQEEGSTKLTQESVLKANVPTAIVKPWQISDSEEVSKMTAMSTTEVLADTTGQWADGYTAECETSDSPGNGDIETFESNQQNQLVIAALSPGEWGNDIGVSVITAEAAKYPCLYGQNAFSWKYKYDDEDKVDNAEYPNDYTHNDEDLTWKKVYKINVYVKPKDKTAKYWGFGLDALTADPVESFLVSNDPTAKSSDGSLYAPYVINGHSNYIYVSKKSVAAATNYKGEISQPRMTWSIYQLEGGKNSSLNNVKEKTAALKLYQDTEKASFDILFNVEGIDSFNGKQRYAAHQQRIGEIAASREDGIGVIQVTSMASKTAKQELSEAKSFAFNNGSYIAAYAGYDRYFDSYTSTYVYLPKSVAGACAMCKCDTKSYPWMAPAGTGRGSIDYSDRPYFHHTAAEIGQLYDINVNTSTTYEGAEVLLGQKTMLKKESALNRIDVRRLINYIAKNLKTKLFPYLFEKNTVNTRTSIKTTVDSLLSRIMSAQGIIQKEVTVATDADDTHIVYVNISIVPAESIEWICVTIGVNRNTGEITIV